MIIAGLHGPLMGWAPEPCPFFPPLWAALTLGKNLEGPPSLFE